MGYVFSRPDQVRSEHPNGEDVLQVDNEPNFGNSIINRRWKVKDKKLEEFYII